MIELADRKMCTGCGACAYVCPKHCITMKEDEMHVLYPDIDHDSCLQCGKCQKTCPVLEPVTKHNPIEVYAARSTDTDEAKTSASGGIACTMYRQALDNGAYISGAIQNPDFSVTHAIGNEVGFIEKFKNSKYVFSSAYDLFAQISSLLKEGHKIMIAALPCQIAAIRKIFKDNDNIFLVDIVCHGTTPTYYLQEHIKKIEDEIHKKAVKMYFRDPNKLTYTFTFTLYDKNDKLIYAKCTKDGDTYQYGYHRAVSYRENCYNCPFASNKRGGDISLADYPGLGSVEPFPYEKKHINCVLINTQKGKSLFDELVNKGFIEAYHRPLDEAVKHNKQLRSHVEKSKDRLLFEKRMNENDYDFEISMMPIMTKGLRREKIRKLEGYPKRVVRKLFKIAKSISK